MMGKPNKDRDAKFALLGAWAADGDVLFEGLMESNEVPRTVALARHHPTHVIFLSTPLDECLAAINARRLARGVTEPVSPKNTADKWGELNGRIRGRLQDAATACPGLKVYSLGREEAFAKCCELLGLTP